MNKWWWRWYLWYEGWIHRKAQYSFFISEEDKKTAISQFRLNPDQCLVITYGIDRTENNILTKQESRRRLGIDPQKAVFLFNGTLDYKPNHDAIINFIEEINPSLQKKLTNYEIIITGNRISKELIQNLKSKKNITYRGYVDNIDIYYQAADLFLNPITNDTGVKTKVIESIANNCTVISTESGASGIMRELSEERLITVPDNDWDSFVDKIIEHYNKRNEKVLQSFNDYYSWRNITEKAATKIKEVIDK